MRKTDIDSEEMRKEDMICGLTADESRMLRAELCALPDTMPPRAVWHRIREQAQAEGLFRQPAADHRARWLAGAGLAAAVLIAVTLVNDRSVAPEATFPVVPELAADYARPAANLQALMVESRQLEDDLRALPAEPKVVRAGTQATILELEDRIATIDYQLSDPVVRLSDEDREIFWRERVRLMKLLVQLRYAQTQRATF